MEFAAFFFCLAAVLLVPLVLRHRMQVETLRLIGETAGKGVTIDPALVAQLVAAPKPNLARLFGFLCLFLGPAPLVIGIVTALAVALFGDQFAPGDMHWQWLQLAIFAGGAGLGYTIVGFVVLRLYGRERDA